MLQTEGLNIGHHAHFFQPQMNQIPTQLRKKIQNYSFCLSDKIGKGFSSVVYKGKNDLTNQTVAIKVIQLQSLRDQVTRNLLQAQLECMKKINHPNLLKCYDSYKTLNNCYIITQFCEGGDLEKQLRQKGRFSEGDLIKFFAQFYLGYQSFLNSGYIHRDLKPANIFIKGDQIKIADFGMIKKLSQNPRDNYNVGTPVYMPPESLFSNIYTEKSDVWSIGIMCFHLTHGILPWKGNSELQLKLNIQNNQVLYDYNLISMDLIKFISKCLEKNPQNRMSISQMLFQPWMIKSVLPLIEANRCQNMNLNMTKSLNQEQFVNNNLMQNISVNLFQKLNTHTPGGHRQGSFHFTNTPNQRNILYVPSRNASNPKSCTVQNKSTGQLQPGLEPVPVLQLIQNRSSNDTNTSKQPKSQRLTMDSEQALPENVKRRKPSGSEQNKQNEGNNKNLDNASKKREASIKQLLNKGRKTPLQYLISILNYLRYIHRVYRIVQETNNIYLSESVKNTLKSILVKQLIKCLSNQQKIIKNKQNVYQLSPNSWDQFINSKKWLTYVNVVEQYSVKYRKIYDEYINKRQNTQIVENNYRRISQPLKNVVQTLHKTLLPVVPTVHAGCQNQQIFKIIQILDYLVAIYSLEQLIFCYGWLIFVQKSPINQIVESKLTINNENYREIWTKLQNKINGISKF